MAIPFEDLLSILCARFEPQHANEFQLVYAIDDAAEAKLAYDVLIAYGFDAKVYHDAQKGSKLYITPPGDASPQQKFTQALAYARALKQIKSSLDVLNQDPALVAPEYHMTFANTPGGQKQLSVTLSQQLTVTSATQSKPATPRPAARPAPAAKRVPVNRKDKEEENFLGGPSLGKRYYPGKLNEQAKKEQDSPLRQIMLYMTGNAATGGTIVMFIVAVIAILFTLFVFAKSFLCPDFATAKKNVAWYCQNQ